MTMENLKYRFDGGTPTQGVTAIVGVLGSGNLEVMVEPAALGGACEIEVSTAAQGFGKTWQAVMKDFFARHRAGDIRVVVRGPAPGRLSAPAVAASLGMQLAGSIRAEPGLAAAYERGEPPGMSRRGPLGAFCDRFLAELVRTAEGTFPDSGPAVA